MDNIIFVCTGNTCRSPMAEGIFNKLAEEKGLNARSTSAGLWAADSISVSKNSIDAVSGYGVDISRHCSSPLVFEKIKKADLILTMTEGHKSQLVAALSNEHHSIKKVYTLKEYVGECDKNILDPFGMDLNAYIETAKEIYNCIEKLIDILIKRNN